MYAVISPDKIQLPPGTVMRVPGTWQDYCALRNSRGDSPVPRIKYCNGQILLMSPLPIQGRDANILADIVKAILDSQGRNYEAFTPITMELPEQRGIEPDYCFYITRWQWAVGKARIDWRADPPPDLVIEIDVTSYTAVEDYLIYQVPEVWLFRNQALQIYALQDNSYFQQPGSSYFPNLALPKLIDRVRKTATEQGTGAAMQSLRQHD